MEKVNSSLLWAEAGYTLFAEEGLDGIQIERLARILGRNKSGFYHYFSDLDGFSVELIKLHDEKINIFVQDVIEAETLDPDYIHVLVKHASTVMFQVQLTRNKSRLLFYEASKQVDEKVNVAVHRLWSNYLNVHSSSDLAIRYFSLVRDMFYTRISFQNLNYQFIRELAEEARGLVDKMGQYKSQTGP